MAYFEMLRTGFVRKLFHHVIQISERPGQPITAMTKEKHQKMIEVVRKDRRLSIRMTTDMLNCNKDAVIQISND